MQIGKVSPVYWVDETPKYRKKAKSNTSRADKKATHKHQYREVLLRNSSNNCRTYITLGEVCDICGKTQTKQFLITKKTPSGTFLVLDPDKIVEMYPSLEIIDIGDS